MKGKVRFAAPGTSVRGHGGERLGCVCVCCGGGGGGAVGLFGLCVRTPGSPPFGQNSTVEVSKTKIRQKIQYIENKSFLFFLTER